MSIDVSCAVTIERDRPAVVAYVEDATHDTQWIRALRSVEPLSPGPLAKGSRVKRTAAMMGRQMDYVTEVIEHQPGRRVAMATVSGPFPALVTYTFEDAGPARARVTIRNQGGKGVAFAIFGPLIGQMVNIRVRGDLSALKSAVEREPSSPTG